MTHLGHNPAFSARTVRYGIVLAAVTTAAATPAPAQCQPEQTQKITAFDGAAGENFGFAMSLDGDTVAVGAVDDDPHGAGSGSVYVYVLDGTGSWSLEQKLTAGDGGVEDTFGVSVALSDDRLIVGAYQDDDLGLDSGSAYVFVRDGDTWTQEAKLNADDGNFGDQFGFSVALHGDTAVVGAPHDDHFGGGDAGSAYVFVRDAGGAWTQESKLVAADFSSNDLGGHSVAISGDTAVMSAFQDDDNGTSSGSAYVFARSVQDPTVWHQVKKLRASDADHGDMFARALAMDGDTLVVGAPFEDLQNFGQIYIFERNGGSWTEQARMRAASPTPGHWLGSKVDIHGDRVIAGGAGGGPESAVIFVRAMRTDGTIAWSQHAEFVSDDLAAWDLFGKSVAIGGDRALVGAFWDDDNGPDSGSVYAFDLFTAAQAAEDCNGNGVPDCQDLATGASPDCNGNGVPDECDVAQESSDCNGNGIPDECEAFGDTYALDDGTGESNIGLGGGGDFVWLNQFTVAPSMDELVGVDVVWGTSFPVGLPATVLVYGDPNGDGAPDDAVLLATQPTESVANGDDSFIAVDIPVTVVGGVGANFFVGVFVEQPDGGFPARRDTSASLQRSWIAASNAGPLDLEDLAGTATSYGLIDSFGLPGNWLIRARAAQSSDCNDNGVPDVCDVAGGGSADVNGNGVPDECECPTDVNADGTTDFADVLAVISAWGACAECAADIDGDGTVAFADLFLLLAGWGPCP
jgi:hypothetical protein